MASEFPERRQCEGPHELFFFGGRLVQQDRKHFCLRE
jgi:hypothetical protein